MSVRRARGALLSGGSDAPVDFFARYRGDSMALGTSTQVWPDTSGNARHLSSQNWSVAAYLNGHYAPGLPQSGGASLTAPASSSYTAAWAGSMTAVLVARRNTTGSGPNIVSLTNGNTGVQLRADGDANIDGSGRSPAVVPGVGQHIYIWRITPGAVGANALNIRIDGVQQYNGAAKTASTLSAFTGFGVTPATSGFGTSNQVLDWGVFQRFLTDDECAALESDLRGTYGF